MGYHLQVHLHVTTDHHPDKNLTIDQPPTTIMKSGTDTVGLDHNPILADTTAEAAVTPTEAVSGHTTETADAITRVLPGDHTQMPIHITLAMALHIRVHLHTEGLQLTLETMEDHNLDQHINQPKIPHTKIHHNSENPTVMHTLRETPESQ